MKKTRTNKNHNTNKKIKTVTIATLTTLTLGFGGVTTAIYLQPSHYKGDTFTNAKTSISSTSSTSSSSSSDSSTSTYDSDTNNYYVYTESNSTEVANNYQQETNNNTTTQVQQNTGDRAYQPTFKVECVSSKNDLYCVEHIPTGDKTKAITYEQAESFCAYMEQIAYGTTSLSHTMDENYTTWSGEQQQSKSTETNEE